MITYEYECGSCGHRFERSQSINDKPVGKCPKCGKKPHRLISGGSGFITRGDHSGPGGGWEPVKQGEDPWAKIGLPSGGCGGCANSGSCGFENE
jgi:putative FmdB family regulatory protein